jgi:hypothetical protein
MSHEQNFHAAKEYVDRQLETVKAIDSAPKDLSDDDYRHLIEHVADLIPA